MGSGRMQADSSNELELLVNQSQPQLNAIQRVIKFSSKVPYPQLCKRLLDSINALAIVEAIIFTFEAYTKLEPTVNRSLSPVGLGMCFAKLATDVAAAKNYSFNLFKRQVNAQQIDRVFATAMDATGVYYFALGAIIAIYITVLDFEKLIDPSYTVYSPNSVYFGIIGGSAAIAALHIGLNFTKRIWKDRQAPMLDAETFAYAEKLKTLGCMLANFAYQFVKVFYYSSSINAFTITLLQKIWGITESGSVNPYVRSLLYSDTFLTGILFAVISSQQPNAAATIEQIINFICAFSFAFAAINQSDPLQSIFIAGFSALALGTILSAVVTAKPHSAHTDIEQPEQHDLATIPTTTAGRFFTDAFVTPNEPELQKLLSTSP